jgi:hypothetical protein
LFSRNTIIRLTTEPRNIGNPEILIS